MTNSDIRPEPEGDKTTPEPEGKPAPSQAERRRRQRTAIAVGAGIAVLGVSAVLLNRAVSPPPPPVQAVSGSQSSTRADAMPAGDDQPVVIEWEDGSGDRYRAAVDRRRYDDFAAAERDRLEQSLPRLKKAAAARIHAAMVPIFEEVEGRVSQFADWVFNWWTSWILLARALRWTWDSAIEGRVLTVPDEVQERLVAVIEQRFVELVLRLPVTEPKLSAALGRVLVSLREDLARECRSHETALGAFIESASTRVERLDAERNWLAEPGWNGSGASVQLRCGLKVGVEDEKIRDEISKLQEPRNVNATVNDIILRMSRPFATKLISFVVLPVIVTALIGGIALPLLGILPNPISGVIAGALTGAAGAAIIGFSASASVDWILNRTDETINRARFEVEVRRAVIAGRTEFEDEIAGAQGRLIERQLIAIATAGLAPAPRP